MKAEKRLVLSHGGKGGVGKSTLAMRLVDAALEREGAVIVIEGDAQIDDVRRRYEGTPGVLGFVAPLARPETSVDAIVSFFDQLEARLDELGEARTVIVNTPAAATETLDGNAGMIVPAAHELGYTVVVTWTLGAAIESAQLAGRSELARLADRKVAVANLRFGAADTLPWIDSPEREAWLASGGLEAVLPDLAERVAVQVRTRTGPFAALCRPESGLSVISRQVLKNWLRQSEPMVDAVFGDGADSAVVLPEADQEVV